MSGALDRIEGVAVSYRDHWIRVMGSDRRVHLAVGSFFVHDVLALVAVARAAERMDKQIWTPQDCDPDEYHDATMALREALSRLGKDTA